MALSRPRPTINKENSSPPFLEITSLVRKVLFKAIADRSKQLVPQVLTQARVDQLEAIDSNVQHRKTVLGLHRNTHQGIAQMPTKSGEIPQPRQLIKEQRTLSLPLPIKSSEGSLNAGLEQGRGLGGERAPRWHLARW